ncbi:MAG: glycosyltransferase family 4 protein [Planctomycetes bacterium]|nr:glycosyltransferase family 4 protein [Planctomycetota bacterium]
MTAAPRVLYHHRIRADDGQAVHVREMIAALRGRGCAVDECALVPKVEVAGGGGASVRPAAGSFWRRLSLPRAAVEALEILYNGRGRAMLRAAAARSRPDFVYERHALHCRAGLDVARELGVPLLMEVNSPMTVEMARLGQLRFPRRARATERAALAGADAVLAVTHVLADMLVELGARRERVHVIGNGAVPARYGPDAAAAAVAVRARWALPAGAFALGFVGYMRPWHRLDLVLDAMARPELAALALVLMGEGPALAPLRAAAAARGLGERVRVLGVVPPALLPAHVLACEGALIPAMNAYASPLKLFDSLAAGVPTIAPDQPNLRETLAHGDTGLLFRPGDADDLARQLARLVGDRAAAQALGARGRAALHAQRWTWDGNAERVLAVFAGLRQGVGA